MVRRHRKIPLFKQFNKLFHSMRPFFAPFDLFPYPVGVQAPLVKKFYNKPKKTIDDIKEY